MDAGQVILDLAVDDYTGLWEVVWRFRKLDPSLTERQALDVAIDATRELQRSGRVTVFEGTRFAGDERALDASAAEAALLDPASWEPAAAGEKHLRLSATGAGEAAYQSHRSG